MAEFTPIHDSQYHSFCPPGWPLQDFRQPISSILFSGWFLTDPRQPLSFILPSWLTPAGFPSAHSFYIIFMADFPPIHDRHLLVLVLSACSASFHRCQSNNSTSPHLCQSDRSTSPYHRQSDGLTSLHRCQSYRSTSLHHSQSDCSRLFPCSHLQVSNIF